MCRQPLAARTALGGEPGKEGGTCGASIGARCTVVIEYRPRSECGHDASMLELLYPSPLGEEATRMNLVGSYPDFACDSARVIYVSPTGNASNDGRTPTTALRRVDWAVRDHAGAEIRVASGTYFGADLPHVSCGCPTRVLGSFNADFTIWNPDARDSHVNPADTAGTSTERLYFDGVDLGRVYAGTSQFVLSLELKFNMIC